MRWALLLLSAAPGMAMAQQDTSYRNGDRMAGTIQSSPQGQAIAPKVVVTNQAGVPAPAGTSSDPIYTSGGAATRTTAAGTSDTQAVPVQGVTGGIPQRTTRADDSAIASAANQTTQITAEQAIQANQTNNNQTSQSLCVVDTVGAAPSANLAKYPCLMDAYHSIRTYLGAPGSSAIVDVRFPGDGIASSMGIGTVSQNEVWNGSAWVMARGDATGASVHGPTSTPVQQGGTITASGGTAAITFVNTSDTEIVNPSTATLWGSWGTPAVNGANSYPIAAGGSYRPPNRVAGTFTLLSTAANQAFTATRF